MSTPSQRYTYEPPVWAQTAFTHFPTHGRLRLGNFPTPLYRLNFAQVTNDDDDDGDTTSFSHLTQLIAKHNLSFYIKRDDSTGGLELGGNKVRKLEFLLAEALANQYDSVITIGGTQSNHCRATAAAARMTGLEPHLILRCKNHEIDNDLGFVGNLLMDRLLQAKIYTCTTGEYGRFGSVHLVQRLARYLQRQHDKKPYCIPVGGSNGLGSWGYIEAVQELLTQWEVGQDNKKASLDHIVMACGSGGTTAGIAVGVALAFTYKQLDLPTVHAVGVCDSPDYFYQFVAGIVDEMGFMRPSEFESTEDFVRAHLVVHQGKGAGYAASRPEELAFIESVAVATGVALDPVYSGKALYNFMQYLQGQLESPDSLADWENANILFWHTGGGLGLYEQTVALEQSLKRRAPCQRLDLYGNKDGIDLSEHVE